MKRTQLAKYQHNIEEEADELCVKENKAQCLVSDIRNKLEKKGLLFKSPGSCVKQNLTEANFLGIAE